MGGKPHCKALADHTLVLETIYLLYWETFEDFCIESSDLSCIYIVNEIQCLLQNFKILKKDTSTDENIQCLKNLPHHLLGWKCLRIPVYAEIPTSFGNYKYEISLGYFQHSAMDCLN